MMFSYHVSTCRCKLYLPVHISCISSNSISYQFSFFWFVLSLRFLPFFSRIVGELYLITGYINITNLCFNDVTVSLQNVPQWFPPPYSCPRVICSHILLGRSEWLVELSRTDGMSRLSFCCKRCYSFHCGHDLFLALFSWFTSTMS